MGIEVKNPNAVKRNEEVEGVELSRKQLEEIAKQAARRRYEDLPLGSLGIIPTSGHGAVHRELLGINRDQ